MESRLTMKFAALFVAAGLAAAPALAQTAAGPSAPAATTASGKLVDGFSTWAGSPENSAALVNGLRSGQPVTLTSTTVVPGTPVATVETATFTPPTRPMGYGNIRIALSLAQQQLASQGITQPTPQQLQAALVGGPLPTANPAAPTTQLEGVLQMRASGMGWGKIANTLGYKLGPVMSGKAVPAPGGSGITTAGGATAEPTGKATHGKAGSGITTAAGTTVTTGKAGHAKNSGIVNAAGGKGSGITTAAGASGGGVSTGFGQGQGHAAGVVSAQGAAHGNAGGQGKGGK